MELAQYWCGFGHVSPSVGLHPMRRTQREKNFFLAALPSLITCGGKASVVAASGEKGSRGDVRQVAIFMVHGGINDAETSEVVVPSTPVLLLSMWLLQLDGFFGLQVVSPTSASSPLQDHPTSRKTTPRTDPRMNYGSFNIHIDDEQVECFSVLKYVVEADHLYDLLGCLLLQAVAAAVLLGVLFFWWIQQTAVRYTVALLVFLAIFSKGVGYFQCMIQESTPRLLAYKKPMPLTCVWISKKSTAAARWSHKAGWLLLHTKII